MSPRSQVLLVRADASPAVGWGHFVRSLALAEAWVSRGGRSVIVSERPSDDLASQARTRGVELVPLDPGIDAADDAAAVLRAADDLGGASWLAVDGYGLGPEYHDSIRAAGRRLMVVDDGGAGGRYGVDLVLDQNLLATEADYAARTPHTRLLLGPRYALLRSEFGRARRSAGSPRPSVARVLVLGGGTAPAEMIELVLTTLAGDDAGPEVVVVDPTGRVRELARSEAHGNVRVEQRVDDMAALMASADLAISGAGSTVWELCCLGVPALLIPLAANQRPIADAMGDAGLGVNLGPVEQLRPERLAAEFGALVADGDRRASISARCQELVDGAGANRVVAELQRAPLELRPVTAGDRELLWEWANDPDARRKSFRSDPIPWDEHVDWFARRMDDERLFTFVAVAEVGGPIGLVRFDPVEDGMEIGVNVERRYRGRGWGSAVIGAGIARLLETTDVDVVHAWIKPGNAASIRAFERAGFEGAGTADRDGQPALHYLYCRDRGRVHQREANE